MTTHLCSRPSRLENDHDLGKGWFGPYGHSRVRSFLWSFWPRIRPGRHSPLSPRDRPDVNLARRNPKGTVCPQAREMTRCCLFTIAVIFEFCRLGRFMTARGWSGRSLWGNHLKIDCHSSLLSQRVSSVVLLRISVCYKETGTVWCIITAQVIFLTQFQPLEVVRIIFSITNR